ncbi:MAG: hypothetical protein LBU88_08820 [Treponema sp.]|jgi:hypothetical protein|nr:hypothetical protein [Treponema sp.]
MFNKLFNKSVSILLIAIFIFGLFPTMAFAQPGSSMPTDVKGFNKSAFDSHFSRADREISPERWLSEAQLGVSAAIYAWELAADSLYDNPLLLEEAKNQLEKWSAEELEARFSQWLISRFFGEAAQNALMELSSKFSETQKNYTWHLDEDGNIIFDDKTGIPLVIRPDDNREFSRDLLMWRDEAESILINNNYSFNLVLESLYSELLAYIPQELRVSMGNIIRETGKNISGSLKMEFENIAAREERILTSRRTRDIWSLRKQSEDGAALLFTQRLIAETELICTQGIDALNAQIEAAYAGTGDLAIMGEEWLRLYKEQFDKGLKAWEEAEERFFIRRIEWEQDSFRLYSEGEKIWEEAFNLFFEQQRNWELQANELFKSGVALFNEISDELTKSIEEARHEFMLNAAMRIGEGTTQVKALIDMYLLCSSAALSAKENLEFWKTQSNKTEEINKANAMYLSYMEKAEEARDRILANYGELFGTGALKDILSPNASSEDFFLDEYQIALIRAQALTLYWERKTLIAEAVIEYGQDLSAGRMTEAEGLRAWENAKAKYNESLVVYAEELSKLNEIGTDIKLQQEKLDQLALEMQEIENELNRLNTDYNVLLTSSLINRSDFYLADLNSKYLYMINYYKIFLNSGSEAEYFAILENGMNWGNTEQRELVQSILDFLNNPENDELEIDQRIRLAGIEMFNENITEADWYFYVTGTNLSGENVYQKLIKDLEKHYLILYDKNTEYEELEEPELNINEYLAEYVDNVNYYFGLIDLYENFVVHTYFFQREQWVITLNSLNELFAGYDIEQTDSLIPDVRNIYEAILLKGENAEENSILFIQEFYNCFTIIPEWLEYEIVNWINAVMEYFYVYLNDEVNEKHWRQYLAEGYIDDIDPDIITASSEKEGKIEDAFYAASYLTNRLNDAFALFSQDDFEYSDGNSDLFYNLYSSGSSSLNYYFFTTMDFFTEITNAGRAYELSLMPSGEMQNQINAVKAALEVQEAAYDEIREKYFREANVFVDIGSSYDNQYNILKKAHEESDLKRFEYEKQDAIQRWASTAYLGIDFANLEDCKTKLTRAQTVLTVLSDIYNEETKRPYENPDYDALYTQYEQSFVRKIKVMEVVELLNSELVKEINNNNFLYSKYQNALMQFGYFYFDYSEYISLDDLSKWGLHDLIKVENNKLAFLTDENYTFTGVEKKDADDLAGFFAVNYEDSVRDLNQRMSTYIGTSVSYQQWAYAREYLIFSFIQNNGDLSFLNNYYTGIGELKKGGILGDRPVKITALSKNSDLYTMMQKELLTEKAFYFYKGAWDSLSSEQKADLEFYTILSLTEDRSNINYGFSQVYALSAYNEAHRVLKDSVDYAKNHRLISGIALNPVYAIAYNDMYETNKDALNRLTDFKNATETRINKWRNSLNNSFRSIRDSSESYLASTAKIETLIGINEAGSVNWSNIETALITSNIFNDEEILELESIWNLMMADPRSSSTVFENTASALIALSNWTNYKEYNDKTALNNYWLNQVYVQQTNEILYMEAVDKFILGETNIDTLRSAALNAYGNNSASWKNHLGNINTALINDLSIYPHLKVDLFSMFKTLGNELANLTETALMQRYAAELTARENEWEQMLRGISDKSNEWWITAANIFESGRNDWAASIKRMEGAYLQWRTNFHEEYNRVNDEWAIAYLAGLEDKEAWLEMAAAAADNASDEVFLSLIGTEGERLSRMVDTREPFGIRNAMPEAQSLMAELLQASGITNMYNAFGSVNNIANLSSTVVMRGMGGYSTWNTALVKTAASDLAKQTNAEIADEETRKLALNASLAAENAMKNLEANVEDANNSFRNNIDDLFIFDGLWRKNGNGFVKDVIKGSTLFEPIITETAFVAGYKDYSMEHITLRTNMDENHLASLNTIVIRGLMENLYYEVGELAKEIFGDNDSKGEFGIHIGTEPDIKSGDIGETRESIFSDFGSGELGRLLVEYQYWYIVDARGIAELSLPPWDKRMWNDDGSWFEAPSLRVVGQIAGTIASVVASTVMTVATFGGAGPLAYGLMALTIGAIGSADELIFGALDVAYGYKSIEEAGLEFGKALAINTATSLIGSVFGGVANGFEGLTNIATNAVGGAGTIGGIAVKTAMTGAQTFATYTATTALNSITYSSENGIGWSRETFNNGMENWYKGVLTSTLSTLVSSSLGAFNLFDGNNVALHYNIFNTNGVNALNNLAGGLAAQGLELAMGGNFTLNILNLSMFDSNYSTGLMEMRFGRDGFSMGLGTGGADVSFVNIKRSIDGITESKKILDAKYGSAESLSTLNAINNLGYTSSKDNHELGRNIWSGKATVSYADLGMDNGMTILGQYNSDNPTEILLNSGLLGKGKEEAALLASVMAHEGTHMAGNRIEAVAHEQAYNAYTELVKMFGLTGNEEIMQSMAKAMNDPFSRIANTGNVDYWKLTKEGNLEYDGFATLRDADGNILKTFKEMGLKSDDSIEGALLWLLNINPNDSTKVAEVQAMMKNAGLIHTPDSNPDNWYWKGDIINRAYVGAFLETTHISLTDNNMGKTISLEAISELHSNIGATGTAINTSINRIFGSAVGFLNYADAGGNTVIANAMLLSYYNPTQMDMIMANFNFLKDGYANGINIDNMIIGNVNRTAEFGNDSGNLKLSSSSVEGAAYFWEIHTGLDYGPGGTSILTPGGYWELTTIDDHRAFYQLYGSDVKMRIMHLNPDELKTLPLNTIYGGNNNVLTNYPTKSYGTGTGAHIHIHIDMTMNLPYNGVYQRQFVSPESLQPGNRFEYQYAYKDTNLNSLPRNSGNFRRY